MCLDLGSAGLSPDSAAELMAMMPITALGHVGSGQNNDRWLCPMSFWHIMRRPVLLQHQRHESIIVAPEHSQQTGTMSYEATLRDPTGYGEDCLRNIFLE